PTSYGKLDQALAAQHKVEVGATLQRVYGQHRLKLSCCFRVSKLIHQRGPQLETQFHISRVGTNQGSQPPCRRFWLARPSLNLRVPGSRTSVSWRSRSSAAILLAGGQQIAFLQKYSSQRQQRFQIGRIARQSAVERLDCLRVRLHADK